MTTRADGNGSGQPPYRADSTGAPRSHSKTIEVKLTLPSRPPRPSTLITLIHRIPELSRRTLVIGSLSLIVISAITTSHVLSKGKPASNDGKAAGTGALERLKRGTPDYPTLLPADKTLAQLGGWTRVSPEQSAPVYAYTDTIDGVPISVSQQPLPEDFKQDTDDKIKAMAHDFSAHEKKTVGRTTLYIGSSTDGPQSVIMAKDGLLILMKSTAPIASDKWSEYAASLR